MNLYVHKEKTDQFYKKLNYCFMKQLFQLLLLTGTLVCFTACVSSKKYKKSQAQNQELETALGSCKTDLTSATSNLNDANSKVSDLNSQVSKLTAENSSMAKNVEAYNKLKSQDQRDVDELNATLAEQGTSLEEIREKLNQGFSDLADSGIIVTIRNGFLYVNLPETILFKEGSAVLNKKSGKALSPFASVLNNYPKVQIYVIGHTDTKSIHTVSFKDNWSLSTERANSIVRTLRDTYHIDPVRLLAAGRGKYSPVASNDTKQGRAENRRIEFIIDPKLRSLLMNE
jgi:chemotaxis protein MotB